MEPENVQIMATKGYGSPYKTVSIFKELYGDKDNKIFIILSVFC